MTDSNTPTTEPQSPGLMVKTRTLAIIKPHALQHRLAMEPRIIEAGFEIVKERMMQFAEESDTSYLEELFGEDATTLLGEPIWVYVLERRRAVEVWNTLMGNRDPELARQTSPTSLRAVFGKSIHENAVAGPPDNETAEKQISALFASSPPFEAIDSQQNSLRSVASSILSQLRGAGDEQSAGEEGLENVGSDEGYPPSTASTTGKMKTSQSKPAITGRTSSFKARPAPSTTRNPDSLPRTTKAAALRAGLTPVPAAPKRQASNGSEKTTFLNVPGHKRTESVKVASTAEPVIAPRMTKAASLRMGIKPAEKPRLGRPSTSAGLREVFEGVPGHKRRETISVTSVKTPAVAPRSNKSALLRQQKDAAPRQSYMFKAPAPIAPKPSRPVSVADFRDVVGTEEAKKKRPSISVASIKEPSIAPRLNRSATLRASKETAPPSSFMFKRATSSQAGIITETNGARAGITGRNGAVSAGTSVSSDSERKTISVVRKPSIEPRTNRSALLRAAMKENGGKRVVV